MTKAPSDPIDASASRDLGWLGALLAAVVLWDAGGGDTAMARAFGGSAAGFAWRHHWLLERVLHDGLRALSWALFALLLFVALRPARASRVAAALGLDALDGRARWRVVATAVLASGLVALLKSRSPAACPWDLTEFGGTLPRVSHWAWSERFVRGRCFPAGHVSSALGFVGAWFALRDAAPRAARRWLAATLAVGLAAGLAQQARGAHFMSHTLWTMWICLAVGAAVDAVGRRIGDPSRRASARRPAAAKGVALAEPDASTF